MKKLKQILFMVLSLLIFAGKAEVLGADDAYDPDIKVHSAAAPRMFAVIVPSAGDPKDARRRAPEIDDQTHRCNLALAGTCGSCIDGVNVCRLKPVACLLCPWTWSRPLSDIFLLPVCSALWCTQVKSTSNERRNAIHRAVRCKGKQTVGETLNPDWCIRCYAGQSGVDAAEGELLYTVVSRGSAMPKERYR